MITIPNDVGKVRNRFDDDRHVNIPSAAPNKRIKRTQTTGEEINRVVRDVAYKFRKTFKRINPSAVNEPEVLEKHRWGLPQHLHYIEGLKQIEKINPQMSNEEFVQHSAALMGGLVDRQYDYRRKGRGARERTKEKFAEKLRRKYYDYI